MGELTTTSEHLASHKLNCFFEAHFHQEESTNLPVPISKKLVRMKKQLALSLCALWCLGLAKTTDGFLVVGPSTVVPIAASSGRLGKLSMDSTTSRRYTALFDNNAIGDETVSSQALQDEDIVRELMEEMQLFEEQLATVEEELATIREEWASLTDKPLSAGQPRSAPKKIWST
jgi:hypothetical protein